MTFLPLKCLLTDQGIKIAVFLLKNGIGCQGEAKKRICGGPDGLRIKPTLLKYRDL